MSKEIDDKVLEFYYSRADLLSAMTRYAKATTLLMRHASNAEAKRLDEGSEEKALRLQRLTRTVLLDDMELRKALSKALKEDT